MKTRNFRCLECGAVSRIDDDSRATALIPCVRCDCFGLEEFIWCNPQNIPGESLQVFPSEGFPRRQADLEHASVVIYAKKNQWEPLRLASTRSEASPSEPLAAVRMVLTSGDLNQLRQVWAHLLGLNEAQETILEQAAVIRRLSQELELSRRESARGTNANR